MEIDKDNTIPFLNTSVSRDSEGLLTASVCRKQFHTDQYLLAYDSHHPQSVKRGITKCLYDRAKHLTTKPSDISVEKKHCFKRISSFISKEAHKDKTNKEPTQEFKSTAVLPYVKGVLKVLLRCLQQQVRPKDAPERTKQDGVVYKTPCECAKVYIGETGRAMQRKIRGHGRDIRLYRTQKSAVWEQANETGHLPMAIWNKSSLLIVFFFYFFFLTVFWGKSS